MTDPNDPNYTREVRRRQLGKAKMLGLVLAGLVILVYAITIVRMGAH